MKSLTPLVGYFYHQEPAGTAGTIKKDKEETDMKGYSVEFGYMGLVDGRYMLFASEGEYRSYLED